MTEETDSVTVPVTVVEVPKEEHPAVYNPNAPIVFDEGAITLIKAKVCPNCTNTEFDMLMYLARKYNLDPISKQIWAVKFRDNPVQIYAGRDGFLAIAHRSGQFDGMRADVYRNEDMSVKVDKDGNPIGAWCEVWRKDCEHSFRSDVLFKEYTTGKNLWETKPCVMIVKVAESTCLRKAFSVSGLYSPEEMGY